MARSARHATSIGARSGNAIATETGTSVLSDVPSGETLTATGTGIATAIAWTGMTGTNARRSVADVIVGGKCSEEVWRSKGVRVDVDCVVGGECDRILILQSASIFITSKTKMC